MKNSRTRIAALALLALGAGARAQVLPPPQNVLQLQASGSVEVQQDLLQMTLSTSRDGMDPNVIQSQLKTALEAALAEARKSAQPGQMDVHTGNFSLFPRHDRQGHISGWNGSAELVLEGRDFPRITQAAGRIQTMTLAGISFGLSREQRAKVEGEAEAQAIQAFQARATDLARGFGFSGFTLREVSVNTNEPGFMPRPMMAMAAKSLASDSSPVPVEPGRSTVMVNVSGSVQLR